MNIVICITYEICEINESSNYKVCTRWTPLREEANEVIGAGTAIYGSVSAGREFWPFRVICFQTSQELRMLSSVTINCQITKIVMNSGSQLSEL